MPRTISTKPRYSLDYWRRNGLWPRKRDVFSILKSRAEFRLSRGVLPKIHGRVALQDARKAASAFPSIRNKIKAVITSPPYFNVTNYEEDQWLRLWFLGYEPKPTYKQISKDDRHGQKERYWKFLREVWTGIAPLVKEDSAIVCRLGARGMEMEEITQGLTESISAAFPKSYFVIPPAMSVLKNRQTDTFRPGTKGCVFELDYVFCLGQPS
jgi:hypothetical protein